MYCLKYRPNQELLFFCDEHLQLAHLVSLEGDGDGEEDTGSETQVAEAFRQVVQPQWEACHAQGHLEVSVKMKVEEEDEKVDVVEIEEEEEVDEHRGDGDKGEEKNEIGEAKRCKQVVEHGGHRPEKYFLSDTTFHKICFQTISKSGFRCFP